MAFDQLRRRDFLGALGGAAAAWPAVTKKSVDGENSRKGHMQN
jgi:hypothetical protein